MGIKKRVKKKGIIKKEVEEIIPIDKRVINFITNNLKESLAGLSVLLLIILSIFLWRMYSLDLNKRALEIFTDAFKYYSTAVEKGNLSDYQAAAIKLNDVINKYPRTPIGGKSLFYLGNCYYWLQDYNNAIKYFTLFLDKASKKDRLLRACAYEGLGYTSEQIGKYDQAHEYFKKANEENLNLNEIGLMNLARTFEEIKRTENAIELYNRVIKDYPQTESCAVAKDRVFALKTRPVQ